jgi:outer membrane protein OmpA-like peptidoglycan-associated protein
MPALLVFRFDSDRDQPLDVDTELLDELVAMLKATPGAQLSITGHTDATGTAVRNQQLALARAVRMRELLVASGAPASSIVVSSAGSSTPLATNATPKGRALNRRVEVKVLR